MGLCETLVANDINENLCNKTIVKGYESVGLLINREDVDWSKTREEDGVVTIVLKDDATAYKIVQPRNTPFTGTGSELNVGTFVNTFNHNVSFVIVGGGFDSHTNANEIANGDFIAVLPMKNKVETDPYEVYGFYQGLRCTTASRDAYDDDTIGGYKVTLTEENSPVSCLFMSATNYASLSA